MVFKAHYSQNTITRRHRHPDHFCSNTAPSLLRTTGTASSWMHPQQENGKVTSLLRHGAPDRASWPQHKADRRRGNPEHPPSPPRSITTLPTSTLQEAVRRVGARQVLQFSPRSACKTARSCLPPSPCHILSPLTSSSRCALTTYRDPLTQLQRGLRSPSGPLSASRDTILPACHRSYFWVPGDINMPRTSSRGGLPMPLPTHLVSTHQLAVTWLLTSSIQSLAREVIGATKALK